MSEPTGHSRFLALPPELRNRIYRLALVKPRGTVPVTCNKFKEPALLYACQQTRNEALQIYYEENIFALDFCSFDSTVGVKWTKKIKGLHRNKKIRSITHGSLSTGRADWNALMLWLRKYHARKTVVGYRGPYADVASKEEMRLRMMFEIVDDLRKSPWLQVEGILSKMRFLLADCDAEWKDNLEL